MAKTTHLLFDFFGTLVDYSASWTEQGYPRSHALVRSRGSDIQYERFLAEWSAAPYPRRQPSPRERMTNPLPVDHPDVAIASGRRSGSENALQTPAGCLSGHQQTVAQDDSD